MEEKLETVLEMYKKGEVTDYVLERELGAYLGERITVKVAKDSKNTQTTSYCFFPFPEFLAEGFHITYYVDEDAIKTIFDTKKLILILARLKAKEQDIFKKFNIFLGESRQRDISLNYYIGFLLSLYEVIRPELIFDGNEGFLPDSEKVLKAVDKFTMEAATGEDLEALLIDEVLCPEIIDLAKTKVSALYNSGLKIKISDEKVDDDKPTINLGQQEIIQHVSSTYGIRSHTEIPYDFIPSTNQ